MLYMPDEFLTPRPAGKPGGLDETVTELKLKGQITLTSPVVEALQARDDHKLQGPGKPGKFNANALQKDLSRFYGLMERTLRTIDLTEQEACLIADALNGTWAFEWGGIDNVSAQSAMRIELRDAIGLNKLDKKWDVEEGPFASKVAEWTEAQCLAVLDAVERFWMEPQAETMDKLREVGLLR